jgi:hypothetical protein
LNDLLKRLESQKAKLPLEDHSIIDWGVSAIRIRMRQREELMDEVRENLKSKCIAITKKWANMTKPEEIYSSVTYNLPKIINESIDLEYEEGAGKSISHLVNDLKELKHLDKNSLNRILQKTSTFCSDTANAFDNLKDEMNESERQTAIQLAKHYKLAAKDFNPSITR